MNSLQFNTYTIFKKIYNDKISYNSSRTYTYSCDPDFTFNHNALYCDSVTINGQYLDVNIPINEHYELLQAENYSFSRQVIKEFSEPWDHRTWLDGVSSRMEHLKQTIVSDHLNGDHELFSNILSYLTPFNDNTDPMLNMVSAIVKSLRDGYPKVFVPEQFQGGFELILPEYPNYVINGIFIPDGIRLYCEPMLFFKDANTYTFVDELSSNFINYQIF